MSEPDLSDIPGPNDPTPAEIAAACLAIRKRWTRRIYRERAAFRRRPWEAPRVPLDDQDFE